jgi:hypothetical protein
MCATSWKASIEPSPPFTNMAYERDETRKFVKRRLIALAMIACSVVAFGLVFVLLILGPHMAGWIGSAVGNTTLVTRVGWIAQWALLILGLLAAFATVLYLAPNVSPPKWSFISPGAVVAVLIWLAASGLFAVYTSQFASYNKTITAIRGSAPSMPFRNWTTAGPASRAPTRPSLRSLAGIKPSASPNLDPAGPENRRTAERIKEADSASFACRASHSQEGSSLRFAPSDRRSGSIEQARDRRAGDDLERRTELVASAVRCEEAGETGRVDEGQVDRVDPKEPKFGGACPVDRFAHGCDD